VQDGGFGGAKDDKEPEIDMAELQIDGGRNANTVAELALWQTGPPPAAHAGREQGCRS